MNQAFLEHKISKFVGKLEDCWLWTSTLNHGHAVAVLNGRTVYVHKYLWEKKNGPVPDGYVLHHFKCRVKRCINPDHVSLTTRAEHDDAAPNINRNKTECKRGHVYTPKNTYINPKTGARSCLECRRTANNYHNLNRKNQSFNGLLKQLGVETKMEKKKEQTNHVS